MQIPGSRPWRRVPFYPPFTRIARLLDGVAPGSDKIIQMTAGDPNEAMPGFVIDKMASPAPVVELPEDPRLG